MALSDFYIGETKIIKVQASIDNVAKDIRNDEMTLYLKNNFTDSNYILSQSGDVLSSGSIGVAIFELKPEMTDHINSKIYNYEIVYKFLDDNNEQNIKVVIQSVIKLKERIENQ